MNRKLSLLVILFLGATQYVLSQDPSTVINLKSVERIEQTLASDDMQGRAVFTPGIDKAAGFIIDEFKAAGLQPMNGSDSYRQEFTMFKSSTVSARAIIDGQTIESDKIYVYSSQSKILVTPDSQYVKVFIQKGDNFFMKAFGYAGDKKNYLVLVDSSFARQLKRFSDHMSSHFESKGNVVFVIGQTDPQQYRIEITQNITPMKLANLVGVIPGKSKKDEYVIFSAHYDHLGIDHSADRKDSIFNGANDDASGTTAVILLANYFKALGNNERTLVFVAFTAEETGEYGSQYFSKQMDPSKTMAMFNIEMIGTESKWGTNSAYITGYERTSMGSILQKNLEGTVFHFYPDPYIKEQLFYRSDNASLAKQGVAAHTISTSKMDSEPNYHKKSDEVGTLDLKNMTEVIRAIAISSAGIVAGKETPSRVDVKELR